jgi:hypothetical protein
MDACNGNINAARTLVYCVGAVPALQTMAMGMMWTLNPALDRWGNNGGREWRGGREPKHSINFICAHDGFPLADLVMYNEKHNEANGEENR